MKQVSIVRARRHLDAVLGAIPKIDTSWAGSATRVKEISAKPLERSFFDWLLGRKRKWQVSVEFYLVGERLTSPPPPKKQ